MCQRAVVNVLVLAVSLATTPAVQAAQYLLVSKSSAGAWSFQEAQSLSINGKEKLRGGPPAPGNAAAADSNKFDSKSIGRLPEVQLSSFKIVRRAPDGSLLARTAEVSNWQMVLPEGSNSKIADSAAMLWNASTITYKKIRRIRCHRRSGSRSSTQSCRARMQRPTPL
jgi:hypothetical protein